MVDKDEYYAGRVGLMDENNRMVMFEIRGNRLYVQVEGAGSVGMEIHEHRIGPFWHEGYDEGN